METLIQYAIAYQDLYKQPNYGIFHTACSCICAQRVSFRTGRQIRKSLYELCGHPLTREAILNNDLTVIHALSPGRVILMKALTKIDDQRPPNEVIIDYAKISGFGNWSIGAVMILMELSNTVNLSSDSYIRKNLSIYIGNQLTERECNKYIAICGDYQSIVCYFLWRIKSQSINKISMNCELSQDDFI